ncbi:hypothetical protein SKAU_G00075230 [Synaphobranchus kaupii]|uniref:E3 ubiquitin-protein ligase n=1 Tax=Synaphobranchus kaupii TaxID=118154 RepID=A0A9Q1G7I4_SYNKA|nr:hypothetical protein SKAU_G00075230 [Synaphobranchus kaupii]
MGSAHDKEMPAVPDKVLMVGNQPEGYMTWIYHPKSLPGYPHSERIEIFFEFEDGIQMEKHPHPGKQYLGYNTKAYLPNNTDGKNALKMMKTAFDQRLMFTVTTNGSGEDAVTLCDVPLKTRDDTTGSSRSSCYQHGFLQEVKAVLRAKGIE